MISDQVAHAGEPSANDCSQGVERPCKSPWEVKVITYVWGGLSGGYLIMYIAYNLTANHRLAKLPYGRYRTGHALFAWQVMTAFSLCAIVAKSAPLFHLYPMPAMYAMPSPHTAFSAVQARCGACQPAYHNPMSASKTNDTYRNEQLLIDILTDGLSAAAEARWEMGHGIYGGRHLTSHLSMISCMVPLCARAQPASWTHMHTFLKSIASPAS